MGQQDIERFRTYARKWRLEAAEATEEEARRNCTTLAEGYEHLIEIILRTTRKPSNEPVWEQ